MHLAMETGIRPCSVHNKYITSGVLEHKMVTKPA